MFRIYYTEERGGGTGGGAGSAQQAQGETNSQQQAPNTQERQQQAQGGQGEQPGPVPYARFKQVNDELTALRTQAEQRQQSETDLATRLKTIEDDLAKERAQNLRLNVATSKGLPAELVGRLQGSTREELEADAETLLGLVRKAGPGIPPPGGAPQKPDIKSMTPAQIREARQKGQI